MKVVASLVICCALFFAFSKSHAQSAKAKKKYEKALLKVKQKKYDKAIVKLEKLARKEPEYLRPMITLGDLYIAQGKLGRAEILFKQLIKKDSLYSEKPYVRLGRIYLQREEFKAAEYYLKIAEQFDLSEAVKTEVKEGLVKSEFAINAREFPELKLKRMGIAINSNDDEYHPRFSADGTFLIFTRKKEMQEDFYYSTLENGYWSAAKAMPEPLNSDLNEGAHSISADGKQIFFTACQREGGYGSCDIYLTRRNGEEWSKPENLGAAINTRFWESQPSLSADGRLIYFVSDRPGGLGALDIWYSEKNDEGAWTKAKNAGTVINTKKRDYSPYLHPGSLYLFFSSEGHPGYGRADLFMSRKEKYNWSPPENLGAPLNDSRDQNGLFISLDTKEGWVARESSDGDLDIFRFYPPREWNLKKAIYIKGISIDAKTKEPVSSEIRFSDLSDNSDLSHLGLQSEDGTFIACIPAESNYALHVSASGYFPRSVNLSSDSGLVSRNNLIIELREILKGDTVRLNNVFFDTDSYVLKPESIKELKFIAAFLKSNKLVIEVQGHTDNVGSPEYNLELSDNRAKAVVDALMALGVSQYQLSSKGYGELLPIADNSVEEGRRINRRTTFKVKSIP